jgi:predicted RNA-binding protein YlqC (UPF0109 family)
MVEEGRETHADGSESHQARGPADLDALKAHAAELRGLLEFVAQSLVTKPEAVEVSESQSEDDAAVLELRVDKEDLGRVIGKQGRTAKSLRTLLNAAAARANRKVILEIIEE